MRSDRGSAVVEFVAVVPLLFLVGLTVLQLALLAHVKSIVGAAAMESARAAAVSVAPAAAARSVAEDVVAGALGEVPITSFRLTDGEVGGLAVVSIELSARPEMTLLPDFVVVSGKGHALVEDVP